jgi:hypothetical protein
MYYLVCSFHVPSIKTTLALSLSFTTKDNAIVQKIVVVQEIINIVEGPPLFKKLMLFKKLLLILKIILEIYYSRN